MKKVILIALLFIALKAHSQGGQYNLANKPINLGWADNSGVTNIRGQLYIRSLTTGLSTDSVLVVLNGQVRKVSISDIATISSITGLQDSLDAKQPAGNYLPLEAGQFNKLTGGLYMNNNLYIYVRNAANTDNLRLFGLSDTDQLWLDPDGIGVNFGWNANFNGPIVGSSTASFTGDISAPTFNGKALSTGHTSALSIVQRDESGKTGLEDLYLGSGYNDWLSTILTGKASTASLDNYLLKTGGTLSGSVTIDKSLDGEVSHNIINSNTGGGAYSFSQLTNGTSSFQMFHFGTNFTTSGNFIQNGSLLNANGVGGLTIATPNGTTKIVSSTVLTSFPSITAATAGRVLFSTTAGQTTDDADLTFDGTNLTVADATASGHAVNKGQLDAAVVSSRPYDVYTVEISQIGTSAPTVNFTLENTIGSIVWTRNGVGDYTATLTGAFVVGKTWAVITNGYQSNTSYQKIEIEKQDANTLNIYTYNGNTNTDGILLNANLEIRVYN